MIDIIKINTSAKKKYHYAKDFLSDNERRPSNNYTRNIFFTNLILELVATSQKLDSCVFHFKVFTLLYYSKTIIN